MKTKILLSHDNKSEGELISTTIHEAGHAVCATRFRIAAFPEITPGGFSQILQKTDPGVTGLCHFDSGPITQFQSAVIAWCGPMSECLLGQPPFFLPQFKPSRALLRDWHSAAMQQVGRFSDTDRRGILGYRDTWRSCKSAFQVVTRNKSRIVRLAKAIAGQTEKPLPLPDHFPATLADFMRLVIGGSDPEIKFKAFVTAQTELFFAGSQLVFATPEERQAAMDKWSAARLAHWQKGFADVDTWQGQARAFKAWTQATPTKP